MADDVATLELDIDDSKAKKKLKKTKKDVEDSLGEMTSALSLFKFAAGAALGVFAGKAILDGIKSITKAASDEQDAIQKLNTSLQLSGKYTDKASKDFQDFAQSVEQTTKFSGEAILENAALIQSLGRLSTDGLQKATKTATDLSAALGIDLTTASTLVGKAAQGNVAVFKRYGVSIKEGADKAETFANALTVLNSRFGGAAAAQVNTFSGAIVQLNNSYDDVAKSLGRVIINNPAVIKSIQAVTQIFRALDDSVSGASDSIADFVSSSIRYFTKFIEYLADFVTLVIAIFSNIFEVFAQVDRGMAYLGASLFGAGQKGLEQADAAAEKTRQTFLKFGTALAIVSDQAGKLASELKGIQNGSIKIDAPKILSAGEDTSALEAVKKPKKEKKKKEEESIFSIILKAFNQGAQILMGVFNGSYIQELADIIGGIGDVPAMVAQAFDNLGAIVTDLVKSFPKLVEQAIKGIAEGAAAFAEMFPQLVQQLVDLFPKLIDTIIEAGLKVIDTLLAALPDIIGIIADGIVKLVEALPNLLESILKALPSIITALIKGLTKAIQAIIRVIPEIIVVFAENIAPIIESLITGLVEAVPDIIDELIQVFLFEGGLEKIFVAILKAIPNIAIALVRGFINGFGNAIGNLGSRLAGGFSSKIKFPNLNIDLSKFNEAVNKLIYYLSGKAFYDMLAPYLDGSKFIAGLSKLFNNFFTGMGNFFNSFFDSIGDFFDSLSLGGGGGGKKWYEFAEGGVVPAGYPNDSYPAMLSSGETVVPPHDLPDFKSMGGGSIDYERLAALINDRPMVVNLQINDQTLASAVYHARRRGYRI